MVDMLRLAVAHLRLDLDHLDRRRRLGGHIDGHELDRDVLGHLDHVWLLGDGHLDLDHLGGPGVVVVVVLVLVVVVAGQLNIAVTCNVNVVILCFSRDRDSRITLVCLSRRRVLLRLRRVNWSAYWGTIGVHISQGEAGEQEGEDLGYRGSDRGYKDEDHLHKISLLCPSLLLCWVQLLITNCGSNSSSPTAPTTHKTVVA